MSLKQRLNYRHLTALKPHRFALGVAIFSAVLCVSVGYFIGYRQGLTVVGFDADAAQLNEVVQKQKGDLESLTKRFNSQVQERDVAVKNANSYYHSYHATQSEIKQLHDLVNMYTALLKERGGVPFTIHQLSIQELPSNSFEYVLDLVQVHHQNRRATGNVSLQLIRGDEVLSVPMETKRFDFDKYARLTGRWTMPDGFTPQYIEVHISGSQSMIKRYAWVKGKAQTPETSDVNEIPQVKANSR